MHKVFLRINVSTTDRVSFERCSLQSVEVLDATSVILTLDGGQGYDITTDAASAHIVEQRILDAMKQANIRALKHTTEGVNTVLDIDTDLIASVAKVA